MTDLATDIDNDTDIDTPLDALQAAIDAAVECQMEMLFSDNSLNESAALQAKMNEALDVCQHAVVNAIMFKTRMEIQDRAAGQ